MAIDTILYTKYTMRDVASRRELREYTQKIIRSAKDTRIIRVQNQLDIIYNSLDLKLRRNIKRPTGGASLNIFIIELDEYKHEWWTYANRASRSLQYQLQSSGNRAPLRGFQQQSGGRYGQSGFNQLDRFG